MSDHYLDQRLVEEQLTIPFVGLRDADTDGVTIPSELAAAFSIGDEPDSFESVIDLLPHATGGDLRSRNPFVNSDGTVDADAMRAVDGIDIDMAADAADTPLEAIRDATEFQHISGYQEVIDERRAALAAHPAYGDVRYQWQIATSSYAIINPSDVYTAAIETFADFNEATDIVGWLSWRDYGGKVDMYILFVDETVETPSNYDVPLYLGYHTGYGFRSERKLFVNHFALFPDGDGRGSYLYNIGSSHSRKHLGDPTNSAHEVDNDRVPIEQWWVEGHREFLRNSELTTDVSDAESIHIDFTEYPFSVEEFYQLVEIPVTTAESTASRLGAYTDPDYPSAWTLGITLALTLAEQFSGHKSGAAFRAQSTTATRLIKSPQAVIKTAVREYNNNGLPERDDDAQTTSAPTHDPIDVLLSEIESPDDLSMLDGVDVTNLSNGEKAELTEQTEQVLIENL